MYDSITLRCPKDLLDTYSTDQALKKSLERVSEDNQDKTISFTGSIRNLFVKKQDGDLVITGSWPKYLNRHNIYPITPADVLFIIQDLSKTLSLPISECYVSRLEFGFNMPLRNPVADYLPLLIHAKGYREITGYKTGKKFFQTERRMSFYDKLKEVAKKMELPHDLKVKSLLRYELQLGYPSRLLGFPGGMKVSDLLKESVLTHLSALWVREYFSITKNHQLTSHPKISTQKEFTTYLALKGAEALGGESALYDIADGLDFVDNKNQTKTRHDIKKSITNLFSNGKLLVGNNLLEELDELVFQTAMLYMV